MPDDYRCQISLALTEHSKFTIVFDANNIKLEHFLKNSSKNEKRDATYSKGVKKINEILVAARYIFASEGYASMSIRKVAAHIGISVGNLTYYFPSKRSLLEAMFVFIIDEYIKEFEVRRCQAGKDPVAQFNSVVNYIMDDLTNPTTTTLFPEMWAFASHEDYALRILKKLYIGARQDFVELIPQINSKLNDEQVQQLALFVSASMEGHTMFVGKNRTFHSKIDNLKRIANFSFLHLIQNIEPSKTFDI